MAKAILGSDKVCENEPKVEAPNPDLLIKKVSDELDADLFLYSGPIDRENAGIMFDQARISKPRKNAALILCTYGGDADAAYIIARLIKTRYEKFTLLVFGYCKSAGTLIALGADEIVMTDRGELGPLDVQLVKSDDLMFRGSGLDIEEAIKSLSGQAFEIFEDKFLTLIRRGGGAITTKTAADIASSLAVQLFSPITAQIDPMRVGEAQRAIHVAYEYGKRLNSSEKRVNALIHDYPSHTFVIDRQEAEKLFGNVRKPTEGEIALETALFSLEKDTDKFCISQPNEEGLIGFLEPKDEQEQKEEIDNDTQNEREITASAKPNGQEAAAATAEESGEGSDPAS